MEIKLEMDNGVIILKLAGNLVAGTAEGLNAQIAKLMEKNTALSWNMARRPLPLPGSAGKALSWRSRSAATTARAPATGDASGSMNCLNAAMP